MADAVVLCLAGSVPAAAGAVISVWALGNADALALPRLGVEWLLPAAAAAPFAIAARDYDLRGAGDGSPVPEPDIHPEPFDAPFLRPIAYQLLRSPFGELYHHVHAIAPWRRHAARATASHSIAARNKSRVWSRRVRHAWDCMPRAAAITGFFSIPAI